MMEVQGDHHLNSSNNSKEDELGSSSTSTTYTNGLDVSDSDTTSNGSSQQSSPTHHPEKRDIIPLLKLYSSPDTDHHPPQHPSHSPSPSPPLSSSTEYGIRRRTRTSSGSSDKAEGGGGGMVRPPSASGSTHSALSRKSSELAMMRELALNGSSPPVSASATSASRRSRTLKVETSTSDLNGGGGIGGSNSPTGRYTLMSGAYQRTSQSTGNLILSRPTTPTLPHNDQGSPIGGSPRSGSPDTNGMLPRSASDQTPKKKSMDDFHIGRVLGEGAYGAVVEATDKETGAQYAIKILVKKHIVKEKKVKYATTERDILGQCFHLGIVKLFYTFSSESSLYYVLELCPNGELLGQIKQHAGINEDCVRFYAAEIIEALEYLHTKGIVHRDLKPENILMTADWHIKLTDFGTAKVLGTERNARSNSFVGTAEYVSPELVNTKETCCASDLWSLGSIIYQMCTNRLPFRGKTDFLTFAKVSSRDLTFPINFPPLAKDLVENLLAVKPEERLGARAGGYAELKAHPFFSGIAWGHLREQTPPTIRKPTMSVVFDELSPPPSPTSAQLMRTSSNNLLLNGSPSNSPRLRANSETQKWAKFLQADEIVKYSSLVWKRKGLSIKKRHLLLTNTPRLIYIDPKKQIVRGEIPWSEHLRPELKSTANFYVHTPKRKYILEDTSNNAARWVEQIQAASTTFKATTKV